MKQINSRLNFPIPKSITYSKFCEQQFVIVLFAVLFDKLFSNVFKCCFDNSPDHADHD